MHSWCEYGIYSRVIPVGSVAHFTIFFSDKIYQINFTFLPQKNLRWHHQLALAKPVDAVTQFIAATKFCIYLVQTLTHQLKVFS